MKAGVLLMALTPTFLPWRCWETSNAPTTRGKAIPSRNAEVRQTHSDQSLLVRYRSKEIVELLPDFGENDARRRSARNGQIKLYWN